MTLQETLKNDLITAMKAKDTDAKDILRFIISQVKNKQIDAPKPLTDDDIIKMMQKEIASRKESISLFEKSGNDEEVQKEKKKIEVLSNYLPEMLSLEELIVIVTDSIEMLGVQDPKKERGKLIGSIMAKYGATVDGKLLNEVIMSVSG